MQIDHVVVLMLENNSFDRMLGWMPGVDGVDAAHPRSNPNLAGTAVAQTTTVTRQMKSDPAHDLSDVLAQMSGPGTAEQNMGFVTNFERHYAESVAADWAEVMAYYGKGSLPVLHALAQAFVVCDRWFSSMPGPTWPNRFFVHSGTSLGHVDMPEGIFHPNLHLYNQETVYDRLQDAGKSWAIYYGDVPQSLTMTHMLKYPLNFHKVPQFFTDAKGSEASFPSYSFIEPAYFGSGQNDEHPPSDILRGEVLLAQVYNAIRNNEALWEKTLLVVLYDEHGGFYDHVFPPACVAPDGNTSEFSFAQYGIRVPAVLISPWLEKQVLSDDLDHTSLLRYATDRWGLGALGARTAAAKSFASTWKVAGAVRTDVPANIPEPTTLPNPVVEGLNPNQLALVGFSRYLETQTMALAAKAGPAAAKAMTLEIGQRLLWSSAEDRHGEVAVERVDRFFELARQTAPARAGAAKKRAKKTPVKTAPRKGVAKKQGAAKKASKAAGGEKTAKKRKSSPAKKTVNPLLKIAGRAAAKKAAKVLVKKVVVKAVKKSAKRSTRNEGR
ncbi:MAG TPA: alkaline phosphatase family protein [Edaphobacter sp.]|nr:alkaline phosphatase family protein [Edaphobacter sp.]